jgi:hypothetical protein
MAEDLDPDQTAAAWAGIAENPGMPPQDRAWARGYVAGFKAARQLPPKDETSGGSES